MNYYDYIHLIEGETDPEIRKINLKNLKGN